MATKTNKKIVESDVDNKIDISNEGNAAFEPMNYDEPIYEPTETKTKDETEKYKVLLVRHDGVVIDYKGNGIFIETKGDYKVGQYIEYK